MHLSCEVCHSPLRAEDVRLDLAVATCHTCHAVYDLSGRKARGLPAHQRPRLLTRPKAVLPERFQVEEDDSTTRITWRWFTPKYLFMAFFCVLWDGFLLMWYGVALALSDNTPLMVFIVPIGHLAVGVWLTYTTLARLLNRTRIEVDRTRLRIHHGPLPWPGSQELAGPELTQLYGEEILKKGKRQQTSYNLLALNRDERRVKLLSGLEKKDQVLYLEQALERRLGIEDEPVGGEVAISDRLSLPDG